MDMSVSDFINKVRDFVENSYAREEEENPRTNGVHKLTQKNIDDGAGVECFKFRRVLLSIMSSLGYKKAPGKINGIVVNCWVKKLNKYDLLK